MPETNRRSLALTALACLPSLLPLAVCRPFSVLGLVPVAGAAALVRVAFPSGFGRAVATVLATVFAALVWVFAKGSGTAAAAAAPLLIALLAAALWRIPRAKGFLEASPVATLILVIAGSVTLHKAVEPGLGLPPITDDFLYALRAAETPAPLTEEERGAAMALVDAALDGEAPPTDLPARLKESPEGLVIVTLFRPTKRSSWTRGSAREATVAASITAAARSAWAEAPRKSSWSRDRGDVRVVVDLAGPEQEMGGRLIRKLSRAVIEGVSPGDRFSWRFLVYDAEPGVDGFRLEHAGGEGLVVPGDGTYFGWTTPRSRKRRYRHHNLVKLEGALKKRADLPGDDAWPPGSRLFNFRSYSFARPDPGSSRTVELYRGNVLKPDLPTEDELVEAIDAAGRWLLGTVEADGKFDYEYFPNRDRHGKGYNEVRHAGSVYGLFHMSHLARKEPSLAASADGYVDAGLTALDRVYRNLGPAPGTEPSEGYVAFLEGEGGVKTNSGAASLTLLSFLERPTAQDTADAGLGARIHREGDEAVMAGLVKTLLRMIDDRGWVYDKWVDAHARAPLLREPLYYPGEAMFALALYHEKVGDPAALAGAQAIGRRQAELLGSFWNIPDHWVMQGMDVLDRLDPDEPMWREAGYRMAEIFMADQLGPRSLGLHHPAPFPDYRGAYRRIQEVPRTTRAAARGEAIGGIARIAWRRGDPSAAMEQALLEGARHLIEQMYTPDNSFFFADPTEGLGAIRMGIIDNHIRIDNNQHGVVALGNALDTLRRRKAR